MEVGVPKYCKMLCENQNHGRYSNKNIEEVYLHRGQSSETKQQ